MRGGMPTSCAFGFALASTFLVSTVLVSTANAQQALGVIEQRIENTFDLVIGNSPDLAIPLTRRALARRSAEDHTMDALAYHDATDFRTVGAR